jgi:iron only hydrogenase large subunit-like protein
VVETVRTQYPELVPYLAPVTLPAVAEARYLRALYPAGLKVAYAGICPPVDTSDLDAAITFGDLEQLFRIRGVNLLV